MKHIFFIAIMALCFSAFGQTTPAWNDHTFPKTNHQPALSKDTLYGIKAHDVMSALCGEGILYAIPTSSGSTPGIDDVLSVGQTYTADRLFKGDALYGTTFQKHTFFRAYTTEGNGMDFKVDDATSTAYFDNTAHDGKFGINTNAPSVALDVVGDASIGINGSKYVSTSGAGGSDVRILIGDIDNISNGLAYKISNTDSEHSWLVSGGANGMLLSADKFKLFAPITTVQFEAYGAGAATFDASGNITSVSDIRLKNVEHSYDVGLNEIMKVNPIVYKWNEKSGMEQEHDYAGFSAQNVNAALGDLATGQNKDGYMSLQDRAIMAALVNSVKELNDKVEEQAKEIKRLKKHN